MTDRGTEDSCVSSLVYPLFTLSVFAFGRKDNIRQMGSYYHGTPFVVPAVAAPWLNVVKEYGDVRLRVRPGVNLLWKQRERRVASVARIPRWHGSWVWLRR